MIYKTALISFSLLISSFGWAQTAYDNMYVNANISEHMNEFIAMEITSDFKESIKDYNANRKNQKYFLDKMKDLKVAKTFAKITKNIELPEIKQNNDSEFYYIESGVNRVEFTTSLFLQNKYFLNGVEKTVKKEDFIISNNAPSQGYLKIVLAQIIASAVADDETDLIASTKNLDTTKILIASIIALDSTFKERSILDKIPFSNDVADTNLDNLVKKIEGYQAHCEESLESQNKMQKVTEMSLDNYRNMGSLDRWSMLKKLSAAADPTYQTTLGLVKKMAAENSNNSSKRNTKLVDNFNIDKNAAQCEVMLKPLVKESKSKTNALAAYIDGGNSYNVAYQKHPCTKMAKLKICLTKFATQATDINDFIKRKGSEAREAGAKPYDVPGNFPAENIGK